MINIHVVCETFQVQCKFINTKNFKLNNFNTSYYFISRYVLNIL